MSRQSSQHRETRRRRASERRRRRTAKLEETWRRALPVEVLTIVCDPDELPASEPTRTDEHVRHGVYGMVVQVRYANGGDAWAQSTNCACMPLLEAERTGVAWLTTNLVEEGDIANVEYVRFDTPRVAVTTRGETLLTRARHGSPLAQRSEELAERDVVVLERVPAQRAA